MQLSYNRCAPTYTRTYSHGYGPSLKHTVLRRKQADIAHHRSLKEDSRCTSRQDKTTLAHVAV